MSVLFTLLVWAFFATEPPPLAVTEAFGALAGRTESCSDEQVVSTSPSSESSVATDPARLHCWSGLLRWYNARSCVASGPNSGKELLLLNRVLSPLQPSSHEDGSLTSMSDNSKFGLVCLVGVPLLRTLLQCRKLDWLYCVLALLMLTLYLKLFGKCSQVSL